jgi:transcriptional regulator NrdR family protein
MDLQVQKKDGRMEAFDRSKILNGLIKSGASATEAENITSQVESWAQTAAVNNVVKTVDIKAKVLELLRGVNPTAAASFEAYRKPV